LGGFSIHAFEGLHAIPRKGYPRSSDSFEGDRTRREERMAVAVFARYPGLSPETYDEVVASLDMDANPPAGAILHMVGEGDEALVVSEIWRTEQTFQAFHEFRLLPALQMHGYLGGQVVEVAPLHNLFAVEMDTVERIGAVSLPATYSGAAL
jgi:hypothetical protein